VGLLKKCGSSDELIKRVHVAPTLKDVLQGVFWVQECVPENLEMKKKVFEDIDAILSESDNFKGQQFEDEPDNIILSSSSSAIPPSSFTSHLSEKTRKCCLVSHPVNPVHLIPLVEIVPSPYTDADVITEARNFLEEVGQKPIVVKKEIDSFILNRLQGAVLNEAFRLVEDGYVTPEDLDRTVKDGLGLRWSFMG
jgi:3-hydroxyacyl-CoA dehydrogenase